MYWDDLERHSGGCHMEEIWLANPEIREAVNLRITGDPGKWPLDWFRETFAEKLPLAEALSIGCGAGALERDLVTKGICDRLMGVDIAGPPLEKARQEAAAAGLASRISYLQADARTVLKQRRGDLDAVFFHESLHHFDRLDELLELVALALKPRGLLYLDEYVGPSRHQWDPLRMLLYNLVYYTLPGSVRRVGVVRAPVNREDPTEAVASDEIVPAVARRLKILEQRDYGGTLLSVMYPNLRPPRADTAKFRKAIRRLLRWEDAMAGRMKPYYTVIVAMKKE